MTNSENFRRKFLHRPQELKDESMANQIRAELERADATRKQADQNAQREREKADLKLQQLAEIQTIYKTMGIKERMEAIASIISGGQITQTRPVEEKRGGSMKPMTRVTYSIQYHTFTGKVIIEDPTLSTPGHMAQISVGWVNGSTGQKLSKPMSLTNSLDVILSSPSNDRYYLYRDAMCVRLQHTRWVENEMWWTKAKFDKIGWEKSIRFNADLYFSLTDGQIQPLSTGWTFEQFIDHKFIELYDDYLMATGQI